MRNRITQTEAQVRRCANALPGRATTVCVILIATLRDRVDMRNSFVAPPRCVNLHKLVVASRTYAYPPLSRVGYIARRVLCLYLMTPLFLIAQMAVWAVPFSLAATWGMDRLATELFSVPLLTKMFQFRRYAPSVSSTEASAVYAPGLPHSEIFGS